MYKKIVITGKIIEIHEYEKLNIRGGGKREKIEQEDGRGACSEENYRKRLRDRKKMVRRLISANFDSGSKFLTLTFAENETDVKSANRCFKQFVQRARRKWGDFGYVAVIEFQKRGAIHYHMITDLPYVANAEMREIWSHGFVRINKISHVDNVGAYVVKYMTEEIGDDRLRENHGYLASRNLDKPTEIKSWDDPQEVENILFEIKKKACPVYQKEYTSEQAGKISYQQYNLNR